MARSQAGEETAQTAFGCWQHDPVQSYSNTPVREDCKILQPSTTSNLKATTHRARAVTTQTQFAHTLISCRSYTTDNSATHASPPGLSTTNSTSAFLFQNLPYFQSFLLSPPHLCLLPLWSQFPSWYPLLPITSPKGDLSPWNHLVPAVKTGTCFPTHTCISF